MPDVIVTGSSRGIGLAIARRLGITVNAIAAGFVDTELTRLLEKEGRRRITGRSALRRLPEAEDVTSMVEYLLGEGS